MSPYRSGMAGTSYDISNSLQKNSMIRHSEERSDEESLFLLAIIQERFLAEFIPAPAGARNDGVRDLFPRPAKAKLAAKEE
jgi:hypothetical protein